MNLIFDLTYFLWLLSEILLNRLFRSKSTDRQNVDKNSLSLIWITIIATISISVFISINFHFPIFSNSAFQYVGLAVVLIGMILRLIAVASLGKFFTVDVTIKQDHRLKKNGLYKYLRHPSYFGSLISFIGFGISLNNWVALLLIMFAILTAFIIRIKIEEKVLIEQFGSEYIEYKKVTSGLIPFIY
jgi:protein-S-isoprenylcysteine O-methyltransferase Ste14